MCELQTQCSRQFLLISKRYTSNTSNTLSYQSLSQVLEWPLKLTTVSRFMESAKSAICHSLKWHRKRLSTVLSEGLTFCFVSVTILIPCEIVFPPIANSDLFVRLFGQVQSLFLQAICSVSPILRRHSGKPWRHGAADASETGRGMADCHRL